MSKTAHGFIEIIILVIFIIFILPFISLSLYSTWLGRNFEENCNSLTEGMNKNQAMTLMEGYSGVKNSENHFYWIGSGFGIDTKEECTINFNGEKIESVQWVDMNQI